MNIIGISGSLRKGSLNTAILKTMMDRAPEGVQMTLAEIGDIPHYNGDLDVDGGPKVVKSFKEKIANADALIIATPEYNYSVPGVLKNALDWASRPAFNSVLKDKKVVVLSSSMAFTGGVRAQQTLKYILSGTLSNVVNMPEVVVGAAHTVIENGKINDETTLKFLDGVFEALA